MSESSLLLGISKDLLAEETREILKGIKLLGLKVSGDELDALLRGHIISLENRSLGEIGSIFILAQALSGVNSFKNTTFRDLLKVVIELSRHPGLPIYCWNSELSGKCCLLLALVDGKPIIKTEFEKCSIDVT